MPGTNDFVFFGKGYGSCNDRARGVVNCASLYNRALTAAEVLASFQLGCCGRGLSVNDASAGCGQCGTGESKLYPACETTAQTEVERSSTNGVIPRSAIESVIATSVYPPTGLEQDNGPQVANRHGQCTPAFGIDDGDEVFNCRGYCFQTSGTGGAESMANQFVQVNLVSPTSLTALGIRGVYSGPAWGVLYSYRLQHSLDNVSWSDVDSGKIYEYVF